MSAHTRLFVGNLPDKTEENELHQAFSKYGEILNLELKCKSTADSDKKKFAFITLSASNYDIESCIKTYSTEEYNGNRLHVTRARESFLERLQRERNEQLKKTEKKDEYENFENNNPVIKLSEKLNPRKRRFESNIPSLEDQNLLPAIKPNKKPYNNNFPPKDFHSVPDKHQTNVSEEGTKKQDSEKKRLESMRKKRQEFKNKQMIIKTGLIGIDRVQNKKVKFSDDDEATPSDSQLVRNKQHKTTLFNDDDSEDELNFNIKEQYEGAKGQKVLDLQSRYKSDKRFVLDERFIEDDSKHGQEVEHDQVDVGQVGEREKQYNILQDVLGVQIKPKTTYTEYENKKIKPKLGMPRFDPAHPEHSKFLAPVEEVVPDNKRGKKKKKDKQNDKEEIKKSEPVAEKVEASKEQFYKVSDTLKEAIAQPNTFSLRSLFGNQDEEKTETQQEMGYLPLETPKPPKVRNPLESGTKNPFVYDSSDSEHEDEDQSKLPDKESVETSIVKETTAVWKENLFFTTGDSRLLEGLVYFNKSNDGVVRKERRELKSLMKKRIYSTERKNKMFQKKIGGRKKTMKKSYKKKS